MTRKSRKTPSRTPKNRSTPPRLSASTSHPNTDEHRAGCMQCQYAHDVKLPDAPSEPRTFTDCELATVLHGLRLIQLQGRIEGCAAGDCEHFDDCEALTDEQIDELAERINLGWVNATVDRMRAPAPIQTEQQHKDELAAVNDRRRRNDEEARQALDRIRCAECTEQTKAAAFRESKTWTPPNAKPYLVMYGETFQASCGCILEPYNDSQRTGESGTALYQCETHERAAAMRQCLADLLDWARQLGGWDAKPWKRAQDLIN